VYFKDKTDLLFGIGERSTTALHREFDQAVAGHERGLDQIRAVGRAYLEFSKAHPVYFAVLVRCELTSPDRVQPGSNEWSCMVAGDAVQDMMIAVIEKGIRDGSISGDAGDARLIAVVLWGFLHGVIQLATSKANLLAHRGLDITVLMEQALAQATRSIEAKTP
jgi:AcrR family transcriptional regulator